MATLEVKTITTVSNILLQENDLPPKDEGYLTLMSPLEYVEKYWDPPKVIDNRRRLLIVLPLRVDVRGIDEVIPIPFIVDTGAPEVIYLGSGARRILREWQVLQDRTGLNWQELSYRLNGVFYNGKEILPDPVVVDVPPHHEYSLPGDVRINILGKKGMEALNVNIEWTKIIKI